MPESTLAALRLPRQDLPEFTHFSADSGAAGWLATLPSGNPAKAAMMLREVLSDLNRYAVAADRRFALLDALRPAMRQATAGLVRALINDSRVVPAHAERHSQLALDLCELGATGYAMTAIETIRFPDAIDGVNPARLACEALQRAIAFRGDSLLQYFLLYKAVPANHWAPLHQLYALAERQQLAHLPVTDPATGQEVTAAGEYLVGALLPCCRPNQLRQVDLVTTYRMLRHWQGLARIEDSASGSGLFVIDLAGDRPPTFSKPLHAPPGGSHRYLETRQLVQRLSELRQRSEGGSFAIDRETRLDSYLCDHLSRALGQVSQRHFHRQQAHHRLCIAAGLTSVHYFIAGERSLPQVTHGDDYAPATADRGSRNPFLRDFGGVDSWPQAKLEVGSEENAVAEPGNVDAATLAASSDHASAPPRYSLSSVGSANVSPGGYCIEWDGLPEGINVGDVVCLREPDTKGDWSIAVIRWINQVTNAPTTVGLELLSPHGTAYAAQVRLDAGGYSHPIRVILLPEFPLAGQPHTLLAPRLVFRENQRVILTRRDETFLIRLRRQLASTAALGRFDFEYRRRLEENVDSSHEALNATRFDSIWSEI